MNKKCIFLIFCLVCCLTAVVVEDNFQDLSFSPDNPLQSKTVTEPLIVSLTVYPPNTQNSGLNNKEAKIETTGKLGQENTFGRKFTEITPKQQFQFYMKKYYPNILQESIINSETRAYRQKIFCQNLQTIKNHNSDENRLFDMGINQFTILSQSQFHKIFNIQIFLNEAPFIPKIPQIRFLQSNNLDGGVKSIKQAAISDFMTNDPDCQPIVKSNSTLSKTQIDGHRSLTNDIIDWRCKIRDIPIYQQKNCISSNVIATLSSISISLKIQSLTYQQFSVQQVLSCNIDDPQFLGCNGGKSSSAFDYVKKYGVGPQSMYPYDDLSKIKGLTPACDSSIMENKEYKEKRFYLKGSQQIPKGDCAKLIQVLRTRAVAVSIAAYRLQFYQRGVYITNDTKLDHMVTLVGYDPQNAFLIRNSWGTRWGISGYGYVSESAGICQQAIAPII